MDKRQSRNLDGQHVGKLHTGIACLLGRARGETRIQVVADSSRKKSMLLSRPQLLLLRSNTGPPIRSLSVSVPVYAGHNKWSKIQQKKGVNDKRRGQVYARAFRDVMIAARHGGSADPEKNITLFNVVKKARADGVPKANIDSALQKAAGGKDGVGQLTTYEVLAHGSVGLIIECLTDNGNRTLHQLREILNEHNARFATVMFMFQHRGRLRVALGEQEVAGGGVDRLFDAALAAGAEDFDQVPGAEQGDVEVEIMCAPNALGKITNAVTQSGLSQGLLSSELVYVAVEDSVEHAELRSGVKELVADLEENEGTLRVWTTLDDDP
ncbi:YebC-like protein [Russula earlei]|uniref:YebC-like protein n=1 Tax=Russula earlei TaxID=71964 RepID=A0ACC0UAH3_9AGAM|nr:YebC-like protein [Russula earlei]